MNDRKYNLWDDNDWQEFRAEVLACAKERDETFIKTWLNKIGYKDKILLDII